MLCIMHEIPSLPATKWKSPPPPPPHTHTHTYTNRPTSQVIALTLHFLKISEDNLLLKHWISHVMGATKCMHTHTHTNTHNTHMYMYTCTACTHSRIYLNMPFFLNECHGYFWQYSHPPSQGLTTLSLVGVACVHDVFVHGNILVPVRMKSIEWMLKLFRACASCFCWSMLITYSVNNSTFTQKTTLCYCACNRQNCTRLAHAITRST